MDKLTEQEEQLVGAFWSNKPMRMAVTRYIRMFLGGNHLGQFISKLPGDMSDTKFTKTVKVHMLAQRQIMDAILETQSFAKEKSEPQKQHR